MAVSKMVRDLTAKFYADALEVYKEWRADRDEALKDGWAFYCRHGFHDNAEGLCGPCELGEDGYFWDWKEEIVNARDKALRVEDKYHERFNLVIKMFGVDPNMDLEMRDQLTKWVGEVFPENYL